ncbi:transglutaminase-like cysteine peptidase [Antarcticirhabdus aurantiaca]|uniref:Transglutaminase-like cysteine peptidase n=1 Tax=Antarcticirhabdus aurantiaca TaxID=2606717 RepID=A0ACD4NK21_9HYPH|nr:transglutaminase-like cysteine peptidase [Antarcticirhabdus aurantiaca]WAJ27222.1 transglutaminase-like cysteine peptidase [Jeongeuplla avenae]
MAIGKPTSQPIGHFNYCRQAKADCTVHGKEAPVPVALDAMLIGKIAGLNVEINAAIEPASDRTVYGVEERWTLPDVGRGDCEDFALLKRKRLVEAGIDIGNLLLTVVKKSDGEGHAVLTLRTTQGDFVLDNLDWRVKLWSETPYTFVKRQNPVNGGRWDAIIDDGATALVAATKK